MRGRNLPLSGRKVTCVSRIGAADSEKKALLSRWLT